MRKYVLSYYGDMDAELEELRAGLRALSARVDALERAEPGAPAEHQGDFWALEELSARVGPGDGAVMLVGSLALPTGEPVAWQESVGAAGILESDWADQATSFAALGHPVRVELLRQILSGVRSTSDLAAIESLGTTGQLHHHLRQLLAAGWVRHAGRGAYEVPAARIVPLLACIVAATR